MSNPKLAIVIGSIRPNRFAAHAAEWIEQIARQRGDFDVELVDLKDYPMPLFAEEASPLYASSKNQVARRWQAKLAEFDAFVFTAAECNHGPTAARSAGVVGRRAQKGPREDFAPSGVAGVLE